MNERGPWKEAGLDPRARVAAREAARAEGMSLSAYLERLLLEDEGDLEPPERPMDAASPHAGLGDAAAALDRLTRRIEAAEARSTLAITGIDQSVLGLVTRLERSEVAQSEIAAHVDGLLDDLRTTHEALQDKVARLEADDSPTRNLEALKSLEHALGKLAQHVYEEGAQSQDETDAIKSRVEAGFADLGERVDGMEARVETTLAEAARKVEKAVEQAELRSEGTTRHLSERFSALEARMAEKASEAEAVGRRMDAVEADVSGALSSMESTLLKVQERLDRAEKTTDTAMQSLERTFAHLDQRIDALAADIDPAEAEALRTQFEARFDGLAEELRSSIAAAREEMADQIDAAANTASLDLLGRVEGSIEDVRARVEASEARQSRALDTVSTQVSRISESFHKRIESLESGDGVEATQIRDAVARMNERFEARFDAIEAREEAHLARVSEEMGKLAETLEARVTDSETRSAEAIELVGEQVSAAASRMQARQEETLKSVTDRLAEAEAQQEARLSDALTNVSERLSEMQEEARGYMSPVQRAIASLASRLESVEKFQAPPYAEQAREPVPPVPDFGTPKPEATEEELDTADAAAGAPIAETDTGAETDGFEPGLPGWPEADEAPSRHAATDPSDDDYRPGTAETEEGPLHDYLADLPADEEEFDPLEELDPFDVGASEARDSDVFEELEPGAADMPPAPEAEEADLRTEDYIQRARAAALRAAETGPNRPMGRRKRGMGRVPLYAAASAAVIATAGTAGYLHLRGKQSPPPVMVSDDSGAAPEAAVEASDGAGTMAALVAPSETAAVEAPEAAETGDVLAEPINPPEAEPAAATLPEPDTSPAGVLLAASAPASPTATIQSAEPAAIQAASAPTPEPERSVQSYPPIPRRQSLEAAAAANNAVALYQLGEQRLEAEDFAMGANMVRKAAEAGLPAAQYRMAKLHEQGLGVARDLAAAREWTEAAAQGGNIKAMHDLAVFYADGEGGQQSYARAVEWFRRAAGHGVVDSQYNLGVLYEQGLGISPNLTEALFWFAVAANQGDAGAPAKIAELRERVSLQAAQTAERRAANWTVEPPSPAANGDFGIQPWMTGAPAEVEAVQVALNALGYDVGAPDGIAGPGTERAIRAYQGDQGLEVTGAVDAALIERLNVGASLPAGGL